MRSTFSIILVYIMPCFVNPKLAALRLEKIQRRFLRGGVAHETKPHFINWLVVCKDIKKAGLGIKDLFTLDKALLRKWWWRVALEEGLKGKV